VPPVRKITINYEAEELACLEILANWAWSGAGLSTWPADHLKTLGQVVSAAGGPLNDAVSDGLLRMTRAGAGAYSLARLRRAEQAGKLGIKEAAEAILATNGDIRQLDATLARLATNRIPGPKVEGRGRWSAFGYLESAVGAGLSRQRSFAMRGRKVFLG
jgi:hypothetical protein